MFLIKQSLVDVESFEYIRPELATETNLEYIWNNGLTMDEVFARRFNIDVTRKDLLTLAGQNWLNDEVINFYLNLIAERNAQHPSLPDVNFF